MCREVWMFTALEQIWADVRHAARSLAKNSGFTAVAILTLGLAIGANTAIFSVVDATLLRPLPYPDSDRLVAIRSVSPSRELPDGERTALGNLLDWQAQARSFEAIAGYRWRTVDLTGGNTSERLHGLFVTPGFFDVFGIRQIKGRAFIPQDHRAPMASFILGRDVWQRRFGSDPRLAGQTLDVNIINLSRIGPTPHVLLGIVTADVRFPPITADFQLGVSSIKESIDFWVPEPMYLKPSRDDRNLDVVGKLRPGVTVAQAQAEMEAIAHNLAESYPDSNRGWGIRVIPLREQVLGNTRRVVLWLSLCTTMVLLIACANVASFVLARGIARQREVAIRVALGAGRLRILRQFLVESALVALSAAVFGVMLTVWGIALLRPLLPSGLPLIQESTIHVRVFGFTLIAALFTACVTGIFPALRISRTRGLNATRIDGRGLSLGRSRHRAIGGLVACEVALTLILLITTGLMIRSAVRLLRVDPGFNAENLLTMTISLPNNKFEWKHNAVFSRQVIESIKSLPQVRDAAVIQGAPMHPGSFWGNFQVEGGAPQSSGELPVARLRVVSPGYFGVMQGIVDLTAESRYGVTEMC